MREIWSGVRAKWKYYSDKKFSTIAGTLVYFILMSIAPFMLWLSLVLHNVDLARFLDHRVLDSVRPVLHYMKSSAESAAGGAGIILLATSLYSSTNFFYHLRRSGEIIYESPRVKGGLRLRAASLGLIVISFTLIAFLAAISVAGSKFLNLFLPAFVSDMLAWIFAAALLFCVAMALNIFACPFKIKFTELITGSLLTTALWLIFLIGFAVYTNFASPERLYGRIASLIVFLLWCYVMMSCFVIGMINNGKFISGKICYECGGRTVCTPRKNKGRSLRNTL